jgi:uncharacterized protein
MTNFPVNVQLEVTEGCNHSCFYCYNHFRKDNPIKNKMSRKMANQLIDIVLEDAKPFEITITGGEPFLNLPATLEIANKLWQKQAPCSINSNMAFATERSLRKIKEVHPQFSMLVSLPSHRKEKFQEIVGVDNFDKIYENIKTARRIGIRITPNMVIHKLNYKDVYNEGKKLVDDVGIDMFCATPVLKPSFREDSEYILNREETLKAFNELLRLGEDTGIKLNVLEVVPYCMLPTEMREKPIFRRSCGAGRNTIQVGYNGDVRTCGHSHLVEGNLITDGFEKIWESMKPFRDDEHVPSDCGECVEVKYCKGACRYEGFREGDNLDKKDSRMIAPLEEWVKEPPKDINDDTKYGVNLYASRKEGDNQYTIYNGKTMLVNEALKDFVHSLQKKGHFRVNDYPEEMKKKARGLGKLLYNGEFLI